MTKTDMTRITDITGALPESSEGIAALPDDMLGTDTRTTFFAPDELAPPHSEALAETIAESPPNDQSSYRDPYGDPFATTDAPSSAHVHDIPNPPQVEPEIEIQDAPAEVHTATKILSTAETPNANTSPNVQGAAAYPFTLRIDGWLRPHDRSRLMDILAAEKIPLRQVDIDPQFDAGKILLPRVSEFVGISIIQALRDAPVRMWLTPSERSPDDASPRPTVPDHLSRMVRTPRSHLSASDTLPLLTGDHADYSPFDAITTSANLISSFVEASDSPEYTRLVDALSRQLKYQARSKGADAIVRFSMTLVPLSSPQSFKIIASGLAARRK